MTEHLDILADNLPDQSQGSLSFCGHQPKQFRAWLDALPIANVGTASKSLYQALQEISTLKISPNQRFELLEMLRPKIHLINDILKGHYEKTPLVLTAKSKKIASLSQALNKLLATNYKMCLVGALNKKSFLSSKKSQIPIAIHRHLAELAFVLLRCCKLYLSTTPNFWLELHALYAIAEKKGLLDFSYNDELIDNNTAHTIDELYKKILAFSLAQPNQLHPKDLDNLFFSSNKWAHLITISHSNKEQDPLYAIELNTDMPPRNAEHIEQPGDSVRFICLEPLLDYLSKNPSQMPKGNRNSQTTISELSVISPTLHHHLLTTWSQSNKRRRDRLLKQGPVTAILGFSQCFGLIKKMGFCASPTDSNKSSHKTPSQDTIELGSVNPVFAQSSPSIDQTIQCKMIDVDQDGVGLMWDVPPPARLTNGSLILLQAQSIGMWFLGVVRWIQNCKGEGVKTGIKFFTPNMVAVTMKLNTISGEDWVPAILIPPATLGAKPTMIVSPNQRLQGIAQIQYSGTQNIRFAKIIHDTSAFRQTEIICDDENFITDFETNHKQSSQSENNSASDDDELNSLWAEL